MWGASGVRRIGTTALELVDSDRLVRRLSAEQREIDLKFVMEDLEHARESGDEEAMRLASQHVLRVVSRGLARAVEIEQKDNHHHLGLVRDVLGEDMNGGKPANLELSAHEELLLRGNDTRGPFDL